MDRTAATSMGADLMMLPTPEPVPSSNVMNVRLVVWVTVTIIATAALLAGVLVLLNRPDWWRGYLAASVVSALAAALSVGPLTIGLRSDQAQRLVVAYFTAAAVRGAVSLGGCLLAVMVGGYPARATLLLMVVYYFALLAVETALVARVMWTMRT